MPAQPPPDVVVDAFISGTTHHTRRVEICEPNGVVLWRPEMNVDIVSGSVSVDYSRSERRSLDLVLDNKDFTLINAPGEFWYDKIIKVYRGVKLKVKPRTPRIAILTDDTNYTSLPLRTALGAIGYTDTTVMYPGDPITIDALMAYDFVITDRLKPDETSLSGLVEQAFNNGIPVFTLGKPTKAMRLILYGTSTPTEAITTYSYGVPLITPLPVDHPTARGWKSIAYPPGPDRPYFNVTQAPTLSGTLVTVKAIAPGGNILVVREPAVPGGGTSRKAAYLDMDHPWILHEQSDFRLFLLQVMNWLNPIPQITEWETQIGEFMIDRISEDNFPHTVSVTGRDYSKKCLLSKFPHATQFDAGFTLEAIINSIAGAAGISKRAVHATGVTVNKTFFFDKGVSRWDAMDEIVKAYDHEIFFDAQGYLVLRAIRDPLTTAPAYTFSTGHNGVIARFSKTTSDTRIYNVVSVMGESSDQNAIPVYAFARNDNPASPTSTQKLGERVYEYTSSFITTTAQAQTVADSFLKIHALEEYEVSFDTLMLPWLEAGDIIRFIDPNPAPDDPDTYLFASISIPLELGPMSSSAKRVIKVV